MSINEITQDGKNIQIENWTNVIYLSIKDYIKVKETATELGWEGDA